MSDIFLSYASEDRDRVRPLVERLEEHGWSVWWDRRIPPGKTWAQVIEEALEATRAMMVVWTRTSVESEWVEIEAAEGKKRGVLVPVRLDEVSPPLEFRRIQAADLTAWDGSASHTDLQAVFSALEAILGVPTPAVEEDQPVLLPHPSLGDLFKGREDFLEQLRESLERAAGHATAIVAKAVHGLGGVGKTRLAIEYAWRSKGDYSALLFVAGETPQLLNQNLAALTAPEVLNLPEHEVPDESVQRAAALRWLNGHPGWLLILDNLDTPEAAAAAEGVLAKLQGGHVLLTSRLAQWSGAVQTLELDVLDAASATQFLLERTDGARRTLPTDEADAGDVADDLDGLAIALEQAGAYVGHRRISLAEYRDRWRSQVREVQEWHDERLMMYPRSLAVTWQTTIDQLGAGEIALLRLLAWLAPEPVPLFVWEGDEAEALWREATSRATEPITPTSPSTSTTWLGCSRPRTVWLRRSRSCGAM